MDTELAELTGDLSDEQSVGVRSTRAPLLLTFEAPSLTVEVEVLQTATARRLLGQVVPPRPRAIEVRHRGGTKHAPADEVGRFTVDNVAAGPVSLRCSVGPRVVQTDWFIP